jgi:hypothetical protein
MVKNETNLVLDEPFLSVVHDMWTAQTANNALGSSLRFLTSDFKLVQVASLLVKNNVTHGAGYNATTLKVSMPHGMESIWKSMEFT